MKKHVLTLRFVALAGLGTARAQLDVATFPGMVQVGGMGQHIIARNLVGIACQAGKPTGFGTAELYCPYIAGIPGSYLFQSGASVQDQTTATITAVFSKIETSQTRNDKITDVFLKSHLIYYYYHPNSSPKSWDDFDGFQSGQLIAIDQVQRNMFSVVPPASPSWLTPDRGDMARISSSPMEELRIWRITCREASPSMSSGRLEASSRTPTVHRMSSI